MFMAAGRVIAADLFALYIVNVALLITRPAVSELQVFSVATCARCLTNRRHKIFGDARAVTAIHNIMFWGSVIYHKQSYTYLSLSIYRYIDIVTNIYI